MQIRLDILNPEKSLLGIDYEILYFSDKFDEDKQPIIEQFGIFSIGLILLTLVITWKRGN